MNSMMVPPGVPGKGIHDLPYMCIIKIFRGEGVVDGEGVAVKGA